MPLVKRDLNELRYNSLFLLPKDSNPNYYKMLIKNFKAFAYGMNREDLIDDLDFIIREKIEKVMGVSMNQLLMVYKNLPYLNSFTRSKNPMYENMNIYKFTMEKWLEEVEDYVFRKAIQLEGQISFQTPARQFI